MLEINNLDVLIEGNKILSKINLNIKKNTIHSIMGKNGSGKSTLAGAVMGFSHFQLKNGFIKYKDINLLEFQIHERSKMGIFLSYQNPISITGITVGRFLKKIHKVHNEGNEENNSAFTKELLSNLSLLKLPNNFINRFLNDGFSGGEKKKLEMLQILTIKPNFIILDEIDSGLDSDALNLIADIVLKLKNSGATFLVISHQKKILDLIKPDAVSVIYNGSIAKTGDISLIEKIERDGYSWLEDN